MSSEEKAKVKLPDREAGEMLGKVLEIVGDDRARVYCEDGVIRIARIPGRYRKRMWIREGDIVIVLPWEFQKNKADIMYKYSKNEVEELRKMGLLDKLEAEELI